MAELAQCPNCKHELPVNAPMGLCPACLLTRGIDDSLSLSHPDDPGVTASWNEDTPARSALDVLAMSPDEVPRIVLRETKDEPLPGNTDHRLPDTIPETVGRYRLHSRIGCGGAAEVFRGHDTELGREIAFKVLRGNVCEHPDLARLFVEEAQICGQLVHPGIVPIYERGRLADGRPFFTMKLVSGRTLRELLGARQSPAEDLLRYLMIFEQVCRAVAYAHARGVIHRDLKPSNIMVGSFGEVQVMDWGLAKVLPMGREANGAEGGAEPASGTFSTVRSTSQDGDSMFGWVLGTPAYMSPEQAKGYTELTDERTDVFGLGSILCEVITGQPAYTGSSQDAILEAAISGDTAEAMNRLEARGADPEFCELTRRCLSFHRQQRPRHAGEVAKAVTAHLSGVQERARQAELDRVEAEARAQEEIKRTVLADQVTREADARTTSERRRRWVTVGLAASVLALAGLAGGTWLSREQSSVQRRAVVVQALDEARTHQGAARSANADGLARLAEAMAAVERAEGLLAQGGDARQKDEVKALKVLLIADREAVRKEHAWLERLINIRTTKCDSADGSSAEAGYAAVFRETGIDPDSLSTQAVGRIRSWNATVAHAMAAALDDWAAARRTQKKEPVAASRLLAAARLADPDPWRDRVRAALDQPGAKDRLGALRAIADSARVEELPAANLDLLGTSLLDEGDAQGAAELLRKAQRAHPRDGWLKYNLARSLDKLGRTQEAIRYFMAARTIHPETGHELAHALERSGERDEAIAVFQNLVHLRRTGWRHLICLLSALNAGNHVEEARAMLESEAAVLTHRLGLPIGASADHPLGIKRKFEGTPDEAIAAVRRAIDAGSPDAAFVQRADRVIGEIEAAIALAKRFPVVLEGKDCPRDTAERLTFAQMAYDRRHFATAARFWAEGFDADPKLGAGRDRQRLFDASRAAILAVDGKGADEPPPDDQTKAHLRARAAQWLKADLALWIKALESGSDQDRTELIRTMKRWKTDTDLAGIRDAEALNKLPADAQKPWRTLWAGVDTLLKPDDAWNHTHLGEALNAEGQRQEAAAEFDKAVRLAPYDGVQCFYLAMAMRVQGHMDKAIELLGRAAQWDFEHNEHIGMAIWVRGEILRDIGQYDEAVANYRRIPDFPHAGPDDLRTVDKEITVTEAHRRSHAARADALAGCGRGKDNPPPDKAARVKLRARALDWFKTELSSLAKAYEPGPSENKPRIVRTLEYWKSTPDLAGVRDAEALNTLPEHERRAWITLWSDVDSQLNRARKM